MVRPGASRSMTALVASGVTSRGEKPVPPVVRITSMVLVRVHCRSLVVIWGWLSGTMAV